MDLKQIITTAVTNQIASGVSDKLNLPQDKSQSVVDLAIPAILAGLAKNTTDPNEAQKVSQTLTKKHKGSTLNDIPAAITNDQTAADGAKILSHIFGTNQTSVSDSIGTQTNVDTNQVQQILSIAAPIVLDALGKKQQNDNLNPSDLASVLQNTVSNHMSANPKSTNLLTQLLDRNNDGSIVDDVVGMGMNALGNFLKNKK